MTKTEFMSISETEGWDYAVDGLLFQSIQNGDKNIEALRKIYHDAYCTDYYQKTNDPDYGLCYKIRKFAVDNIIENLED